MTANPQGIYVPVAGTCYIPTDLQASMSKLHMTVIPLDPCLVLNRGVSIEILKRAHNAT